MSNNLFRAITVRCMLVGICGLILGGVAIHAEATRPAPASEIIWLWEYEH